MPLLQTVMAFGILAGCAGQSIKPAEVLDERSGMTVGALQEPLEFVESAQNAALASGKRPSFAYLGPVEWDLSGDITYGLWVDVAPGNDRQIADIRSAGAVTLNLDGEPLLLVPMEAPKAGKGPYHQVASWGQSAYFGLDVPTLKRLAASHKLGLQLRSADQSVLDFDPTHETHSTLMQYMHSRGITAD